jgi:hypothetical protein
MIMRYAFLPLSLLVAFHLVVLLAAVCVFLGCLLVLRAVCVDYMKHYNKV